MIIKYIEEKAENVLKDMNIKTPPINPILCARKLGIDVLAIQMDDDISGLFVIKDNAAFIRYNKKVKNKRRNRFTIAHEIGHYVLHKNIPLIVDRGGKRETMYRDMNSSTGEYKREREANAFAAALLMPKNLVQKELHKTPKDAEIISHLAKKFEVSEQAMSIRLTNLGLIEYGLF